MCVSPGGGGSSSNDDDDEIGKAVCVCVGKRGMHTQGEREEGNEGQDTELFERPK